MLYPGCDNVWHRHQSGGMWHWYHFNYADRKKARCGYETATYGALKYAQQFGLLSPMQLTGGICKRCLEFYGNYVQRELTNDTPTD
jgi:hypothetical protein